MVASQKFRLPDDHWQLLNGERAQLAILLGSCRAPFSNLSDVTNDRHPFVGGEFAEAVASSGTCISSDRGNVPTSRL